MKQPMVLVSLFDVISSERVSVDIYDVNSNLLLKAGASVSSRTIARLREMQLYATKYQYHEWKMSLTSIVLKMNDKKVPIKDISKMF